MAGTQPTRIGRQDKGGHPMTFDIVVGVIVTIAALGLVVFLTVLNRRIIEDIHSKRSRASRQAKKEPGDERA